MTSARVLVTAILLLAACSPEPAPAREPEARMTPESDDAAEQETVTDRGAPLVALPTHGQPLVRPDGSGAMMEALIAGVLAGDERLDGGCVWLESAGQRESVLWPAGFAVRFPPAGPFQLVDERGELVAYEGDQLEAAGGYGEGDVSRCGVGDGPAILQGQLTVTARAEGGGLPSRPG